MPKLKKAMELTLWLVKLIERTGPLYSYVREQVLPVE